MTNQPGNCFQPVKDFCQVTGFLVPPMHSEPGSAQRILHRLSNIFDPIIQIGDEVHVVCWPFNEAVQHQGVAATQHKPVPGGRPERDGGDLAVKLADRH